MSFIKNDGIVGNRYDPSNESSEKRLCIFYKFPYFKDIAIRHTKKNIAYAIIETLFGIFDTISSCNTFKSKQFIKIFGLKNMMMKNIENLVLLMSG